jgi:hypothetical protein
MSKDDVINSWSDAMGRDLASEKAEKKSWSESIFGSKEKQEILEDDAEVEIFENQEGEEVRMKIHGSLEVEGDEYAIMSYADSFSSEFEIMKIKRGRGNSVSYSNVDDDELYDDLSEAAAQHLEASGVL